MDRFLVGIDGSECGDRALAVAARHARSSHAELLVCYVIPWSPYGFATPEENEQRHRRREEELTAARQRMLDPRVGALVETGLAVEGLARHGHPARTLMDLAGERSTDLLVVGRSGDTPLKTRIFGGTAAALVQSAPIPVMVVP